MANNRSSFAPFNLSLVSRHRNDGSKFSSIPSSLFVMPNLSSAPQETLTESKEGLMFECNYCERKFHNKQALGGHQNAHRVLRFIEKNQKNAAEMERLANAMSTGCPFVHQHNLNRAAVNSPYYVPFAEKSSHGYPQGSAPVMGKQIAERDNFVGKRMASEPADVLSNGKILFKNATEKGYNVGNTSFKAGGIFQNNDFKKLQIGDSELDLTLKLGY